MVDNVELSAGSGGAVIKTDDDGAAHWQYVKLAFGADDTQTVVDSINSNPLPVALSAVDNAVLDSIQAAVELIDNAISGSEMQVDVVGPLPAGTNAIGKLAANSGVDIGDVDVTSLDGVAAEGAALDNGILIQGDDGTDRKNINVDATTGDVQVDVTNTVTVDGSGVTQPVSGTVTANLSATDNAVLDTIDAVLDTINAKLVTGTVIGDVNLGATDNAVLDDIAAKLAPHTTNGHSFYLNQDTSAVASVKASAGTIYWIACMSTDATPVYLNLYNVASGSVTLGTTTPSLQFIVPSQGDANGAGFTINFGPHGIQFDTAITIACATTFNGSTDPGTNVVITNIGYE